ncbi:MAG: penicillin-insensitive murein endopeptidase [Rhodospirillales bacterium]
MRRRRTAALVLGLILGLAIAGSGTAAGSEWGRVAGPAPLPARAIGGHSLGCLAGAEALPLDGPGYQVMRPSRQRFYGHPRLIRFVEAFAARMRAHGWDGLLVGDLAQPRGGPMTSGHASHQTGLDVDIWFDPESRPLDAVERERRPATSLVAADGTDVEAERWTDGHLVLLRTAASFPEVDRIFVGAAIKERLCRTVEGNRDWLARIRPWWGHVHHFHVRLRCPDDEAACRDQEPLPAGDGCDASLAWWFSDEAAAELARLRALPPRVIALADLPPACRAVLDGS